MKKLLLLFSAVVPMLLTACAGQFPVLPGVDRLGQMSGFQSTDEEQIITVLDDVQRGMESRQIYKVLAHVSRNYYDEQGRDYAALEAYLSDVFKKYSQIRITRVAPRVMVFGETARAVETFGTSGEPQDPQMEPPIHLQGQLVVNLEKVNGKWQIVEWGEML